MSSDVSEGYDTDVDWRVALFGYAFLSPFWLPHAVVESGPGPAGGWSIAPYPYADGGSGYFARVAPLPGVDTPSERGGVDADHRRVVSLQLSVEGTPPVAGVGRVQARARLQTAYRVEVDAGYALYVERGAVPGSSSAWSDAWSGQAHVAYQFARSEQVQFRAGLGMRHWVDAQGTSLGVDVLYGVDIFWGRPVTTYLEFAGGSLGSAWVADPRGTVGFAFGSGEVFVGYDAVWIGGVGLTAFLGGPLAGMRAYL